MKVSKQMWTGISTLAAVSATYITHNLAGKAYERVKGKKQPAKEEKVSSSSKAKELIQWSLLSGAVVGLAKLATGQVARGLWVKITKQSPPVKS